jgi:hypothetical protein
MKAQAKFPYEPNADAFWEHNQIISKLVDVIRLRGAEVVPGDELRVILTRDDGGPGLFLQGEDLSSLVKLLTWLYEKDAKQWGECMTCHQMPHTEDCLLRNILTKAGYATEAEPKEVDQPEGKVPE